MSDPNSESPDAPAPDLPPADGENRVWGDSPGARLLAERRNQGLSLGDIARQLKLSVRQVEALERDDYSGFAGPVFVRGFLCNYAKLLHLDPEPLLEAAELAVAPPVVQVEQMPAAGTVSVAGSDRGRRILGAAALAVLAVAAVVLLASNAARERHEQAPSAPGPSLALQTPATSSQHPDSPPPEPGTQASSPVPATPPPDNATSSEAGTETSPSTAGSALPSAPVATEATRALPRVEPPQSTPAGAPAQPQILVSGSGPAQVRLAFEDESWVEIKDGSGATIYSRLNTAGTERVVKGTPPFSLVVGNAHGVKVRYKDKAVDLGPHTRVDVARITLE